MRVDWKSPLRVLLVRDSTCRLPTSRVATTPPPPPPTCHVTLPKPLCPEHVLTNLGYHPYAAGIPCRNARSKTRPQRLVWKHEWFSLECLDLLPLASQLATKALALYMILVHATRGIKSARECPRVQTRCTLWQRILHRHLQNLSALCTCPSLECYSTASSLGYTHLSPLSPFSVQTSRCEHVLTESVAPLTRAWSGC